MPDISNVLLQRIIVGLVAGVLTGLILSIVQKLLAIRTSKRKIQVGSDEVEIDMGNIEESLQKLERKVRVLQEHPRVFLSYASSDREFARRLAKDLELQGIEVWLPEKQLQVGDPILQKIRQGIEESQWFAVVISPSVVESDWISKELAIALQSEKTRDRPFVLPILYKGDVLPILGDKLYADFRADYESGLQSLIASLKRASLEQRLHRHDGL